MKRLVVIVLAGAAAFTGCFAPREPACPFSCGPDGACPAAYSCGPDNLCHRDDGLGQCLVSPQDGASGAADAGSDSTD